MKYVTQSRSQGVNDTASNKCYGRLSIEDILPICGLGPQKSTNIQTVIHTRQCTAWELKILELLNSRAEKFKNVKSLSWIG